MSSTGNENYTSISYTSHRRQRDSPDNKQSVTANRSTPAKSSTIAEALPWNQDTVHSFYSDYWKFPPTIPTLTVVVPAGAQPFSATITGEFTADGNGVITMGLSDTDGGAITNSLISTLFVAGNNVINFTSPLFESQTTKLTWLVFSPVGANITDVTTEISGSINFNRF